MERKFIEFMRYEATAMSYLRYPKRSNWIIWISLEKNITYEINSLSQMQQNAVICIYLKSKC